MKLNVKIILALLLIIAVGSCGEKSGPRINFTLTPSDWTQNPSVTYIAFMVNSIVGSDGRILDSNEDNIPDNFGFPAKCITSGGLTPACGFRPDESYFDLKGVPLNFTYEIRAFIRDAGGTNLYTGSAQFVNIATQQSISIALTPQ